MTWRLDILKGQGMQILRIVACMLLMMMGWKTMVKASDTVLDAFEVLQGWSIITSPGVKAGISQDTGHMGKALRVDFDFGGSGGYFIVRKSFPIKLPENYAFSFMVRGLAPVNNLEFKLIDSTDKNVWWYVQRDYVFPAEWQRVTVKKKYIQFGWGPDKADFPSEVNTIELAISAGTGGKGSVWIDDLRFEEKPSLDLGALQPAVSASSSTVGHAPETLLASGKGSGWHSGAGERQWLQFDFHEVREFGGLVIDWDREDYATAYGVQTSDDGIVWKTAHAVTLGNGGRSYFYLPDAEARYLRLDLMKSSRGRGYGIAAIALKPHEFSTTLNHFFQSIARDGPRGRYPKYWYGQQTYWTVVGVDGDGQRGLLNEEGMLEVDTGSFSIEPFLSVDGTLMTWSDARPVQELEQGYLPIPSVVWRCDSLNLRVTAYAAGEPGASVLFARYRVTNVTDRPQRGKLFLALRPFQVNPPWQSLTVIGGAAPIRDLVYENGTVSVNGEKTVISLTDPDRVGAIRFEQGSLTDFLADDTLPTLTQLSDPFGYASAALAYPVDLAPGASQDVYLAIPFYDGKKAGVNAVTGPHAIAWAKMQFEEAKRYWTERLDRVDIGLPPQAGRLVRTLKSTLAYSLISRKGPILQPGPRNYARSWIRDGALISAALLAMGYPDEVRDFIRWYAGYQFANGKIPCCVDQRGPESLPENDSQGEFIYTVMEYYRYTRDRAFLRELWPAVLKTVEYIDFLRHQRLGEAYKTPEKRAYYGLMPESASHEGYLGHPMHSYWDDFFTLRGLKDAVEMAEALGESAYATRFSALRDEFRKDLYASIDLAMKLHDIPYIPGCVELGDFDPTATTIAVDPGGELHNLPEPALRRTFDDYFTQSLMRRRKEVDWDSYTPYELRAVGTFVHLDQRERALEALELFLADQRPATWNQWGEVVWRDPDTPSFIGDMPHTWVGAGYIRSLRSLLVYEREVDQSLVIAAGLPRDWVETETGVSVSRLPTHYGTLNYVLHKTGPGELHLRVSGDLALPPGKIVVKPPVALRAVTLNGHAVTTFDAVSATIGEFPAEVVLHY